ncbi:hypothetical protein QYE76_043061 [Lolium multiflorum]|uniref:Uncharacterized protein n=1 Tax=Lolium multiflorum TaxID=4521 RepID=A0AAD8TI09_LOLMU|nr:hypothetical protein QYE76_043061 [Lolium multiflorum]
MEEKAVKNWVEKIGESVVWGPEQELSLLRFDDWKGEYVRIEDGDDLVTEIDRRDGWTSKHATFYAEIVDRKSDSKVGYVASKLAAQIVDDEWASQRQIMPIVTEVSVISESDAAAQEVCHGAANVVTVDWNAVELEERTDLVIAPMSGIEMARMYGIPVDDKDKEKDKDESEMPANANRTGAGSMHEDVDPELMQDAADEVDDAHADELVYLYDKENPVIEVGKLFPNMDEFRMCFKTYAVKAEFDAKTLWTDRSKFYARVSKICGIDEKEGASEATGSAQSPPPAVSPKNKRKRKDSGTSKPEDAVPSRQKAAYDPYPETLISSDDEEEVPAPDVAARTSTSHTLVASETPVEGEETSPPQQNVGTATPPSSPLVPSPKRARIETIPEPTLQLSSSSNPLLDDPTIKELLRIGAQFIGYREYASKAEEKLAEVNERANTLAQKLEQSEEARKKAESDAVQARREADKAKADAAGVEDLRKRLHDAETSLSEHITTQSAREEAILKSLRTQNRRFVNKTSEFELEDPDNDPLLDAVSFLEFHGTEARDGIDEARTRLSRLFPYFFPKKEEPATFLALAKCFNPPEDLGLKMRHENMKVAVESTVALVADSQQTIDWAKVGNTEQIEQAKWRSLIKAAKLNTKKILSYLGIKPSSTPSSSRPEV